MVAQGRDGGGYSARKFPVSEEWNLEAAVLIGPDGLKHFHSSCDVVSHPSRKNKNAARVGHPDLALGHPDLTPSVKML